ncbi:hypothetical protein QEZ40_006340 [Streptomyces katrae]|uniref:Right handed beta helix domain-containing protein n=1 Tax=Streptomyces katrae TaxID=68223 RepID=A0ABT7H3N1_9ACTN|nr:hypothetical protein [Streptomyces katrae]MDK9500516.1 hypothetical protein [Streptomyces katrae]
MSRRHVPVVLALVTGSLVAVPAQAAHAATVQVPCSVPDLVEAVNTANATPGPDTLRLARECTYKLRAPDPAHPGNGLPVITSEIIIDGRGATIERDGHGKKVPKFRIIYVENTGDLTLKRTTIRGGYATDCPAFPDAVGIACGGGISNNGKMKITHSRVTGNTSASRIFAQGGGIDSPGSAGSSISDTEVNGNHVVYDGDAAEGGAAGGGISNDGPLTVTGSRLTGNTATVTPRTRSIAFGSAIISFFGTTIRDTVVSDNRAFAREGIARGAVANGIPEEFGRLTLTGGAVSDNVSDAPQGLAQGGGIANNALMTVTGVKISGNRAVAKGGTARGGGIRVGPFGTLDVEDSHIDANTADAPEGTAQGAGIDNPEGGVLRAERNEIQRNTVTAKNGTAQGGGLYHAQGVLRPGSTTLERNTITHNRAGDGGGIFKASGVLTLKGDVVRDNRPNNCAPSGAVPGCTG